MKTGPMYWISCAQTPNPTENHTMSNGIIIHGGIKEFENIGGAEEEIRRALRDIADHAYEELVGNGARAAVLAAVAALEDCELFNAGTGSRIQADGEIRMSASLMDGSKNIFSGVINIQYVKNPILVAAHLAAEKNAVLAGEPATRYARSKGFQSHNPYTAGRMREHLSGDTGLTGTVGAVAIDDAGSIFAATSTGGVGGEIPGRVSDSATVAGNYAAPSVGISCTGAGEEIVNLCVAARIATRKLDGHPLRRIIGDTIAEGRAAGYFFGLIAMDEHGDAVFDQTQGTTLFATASGEGTKTFADI